MEAQRKRRKRLPRDLLHNVDNVNGWFSTPVLVTASGFMKKKVVRGKKPAADGPGWSPERTGGRSASEKTSETCVPALGKCPRTSDGEGFGI